MKTKTLKYCKYCKKVTIHINGLCNECKNFNYNELGET